MERKRARKSRIEIPVPLKPRPYRPGDGPALAPLRITLENDSDAFIIDRRVCPGPPIHGELKLQMYYVVGWPDLPAARVFVLATRIYDYVSPRTLEEWEYNDSLAKDKEREKQEAAAEAQARREAEKAAKGNLLHTISIKTPKPGTPGVPGQKKRGRPSKADRAAQELVRRTTFEDIHNADVPLPPASTSGPSLSTPQKRLAAEIVTDAEDQDEEEIGDAIYKQLCGGDTEMDIDEQDDEDEAEREIPEQAVPPLPSPSTEKYARHFISSQGEQINGRLPRRISDTPVPVPTYPRPKKKPYTSPRPKLITPVPVPAIPNPSPNKSISQGTAVPVPSFSWSKTNISSTSPKKITTPLASPLDQAFDLNGSKPTPYLPSTLPHYGFTPAGRSSIRWPIESETATNHHVTHDSLINPNPESAAGSDTPLVRSHKKKKSTPVPAEYEEPVYVVKRLEDDQMMEVGGGEARFFKVRWEGDWPADQNPTWEPEENLPKALVKKYLKRKSRKAGHAAESPRKAEQRPAPMLKRKYSSVAEAFEGEAEEERALRTRSGAARDSWADEDANEGEEQLLVTEQRSGPATPAGRRQFKAELAREIASSFRHGRRSGSSAS